MQRSLALELGEFGRKRMQREAEAHGLSLNEFATAAVSYYVDDRGSGRPARRVPDFSVESAGPYVVEVDVRAAIWRRLDAEAAAQNVTLERLAAHAVMYLLADIESGRVASLLAERAASSRD